MNRAQPKQLDRQEARELLNKYGGEADDFFKLWPPDKTYFFSSDKQAFLAYAAKYKVAVCMGDPVGPDQSLKILLSEFKKFCSSRGWIMTFIQTTNENRQAFLGIGLKSLLIGADAIIDLKHFQDNTIHSRQLRNIVNRFEKLHYSVDNNQAPHSPHLIKELRAISDSWLTLPNHKEWSFLAGRFDTDYLQQTDIYVLRDQDGRAVAFANELPAFKKGLATIDLMRHDIDAKTNSIDYLFVKLIQAKHKDGFTSFNLGISPLDGKQFADSRADKLLVRLYGASNRFIGFKGLRQFKSKYEPSWEPRYVWYQGNPLRLIQIGLAIYRLMSRA